MKLLLPFPKFIKMPLSLAVAALCGAGIYFGSRFLSFGILPSTQGTAFGLLGILILGTLFDEIFRWNAVSFFRFLRVGLGVPLGVGFWVASQWAFISQLGAGLVGKKLGMSLELAVSLFELRLDLLLLLVGLSMFVVSQASEKERIMVNPLDTNEMPWVGKFRFDFNLVARLFIARKAFVLLIAVLEREGRFPDWLNLLIGMLIAIGCLALLGLRLPNGLVSFDRLQKVN
jgi:hypothetical protein